MGGAFDTHMACFERMVWRFMRKKLLGLASGRSQVYGIGFLRRTASRRKRGCGAGRTFSFRCENGYDKTGSFSDESFDLIFHSVSNCYVEEVIPIWQECYRILKKGGVLLAGLDNSMNYLFDDEEEREIVNSLLYHPLQNPDQMRQLRKTDGGIPFSHSLEEQIGGQLKAGFRLTALYEDPNGEGRLQEPNIPTFLATRSIKES